MKEFKAFNEEEGQGTVAQKILEYQEKVETRNYYSSRVLTTAQNYRELLASTKTVASEAFR